MRSRDGRLAYSTSGNPQTHIMRKGYIAKVAKKFGAFESEVSKLLRNIIRDGRIASSEIRKPTVERATIGFTNAITSAFFLRA